MWGKNEFPVFKLIFSAEMAKLCVGKWHKCSTFPVPGRNSFPAWRPNVGQRWKIAPRARLRFPWCWSSKCRASTFRRRLCYRSSRSLRIRFFSPWPIPSFSEWGAARRAKNALCFHFSAESRLNRLKSRSGSWYSLSCMHPWWFHRALASLTHLRPFAAQRNLNDVWRN